MLNRKSESEVTLLFSNDYCIFVKASIGNFDMILGAVYLKHVFHDLNSDYSDMLWIVGGDFNGWVADLNSWPSEVLDGTTLHAVRDSKHKKKNVRGEKILEFMELNNFLLLNGRTPGDYPGKITCVKARGVSVVDLIWVNMAHCQKIKNLSVGVD